MDYLGLRTLTILDRALMGLERLGIEQPDLDDLPAGDPETYAMLTRGDTLGVFQLESDGMRKLLSRLRPDCFEDLIAVLALYRPGPLESGMVDMFTRRKHGEEEIVYGHPLLEPILRDTYGCMVYQEQVMLISSQLSGFSLNDADNLRKAMGKKKPEVMQKFAAQFLEGAVANGCDEKIASETWDNIVKFGGYGFNKSHSTAYALITYQTAYLKAHHRSVFLAANMSCEMQDSDKIKDLVDDAHRAKIPVLPPHIAESDWHFRSDGESIRFGFGAIKGTGKKAIDHIVEARGRVEGELGLHALCSEVDPTEAGRVAWEALIKSGCFDCTGQDRGAIHAALDAAMADSARAAEDRRRGQGDLFGGGGEEDEVAPAQDDGIDPSKAWDRGTTLSAEREVLGFYLSGHPLEERAGLFRILSNVSTEDLGERPGGSEVLIAGLIIQFSESMVRSGRMEGHKMARFRLEDLHGNVPVTCFPRTYAEYKDKLEEDAVVICRAKLEEREDEAALLLEEVLTPDEAIESFRGGILLRLEPSDRAVLGDLEKVLSDHRGALPAFLEIEGEDGHRRRVRLEANRNLKVSHELVRDVEGLLGPGRMKLARM
jgi:DNA polymerase-3 subunit alpha